MPNVLTAADIAHYHREGYCLVRGLLNPADCAMWRESILRI